jgi:hypothetical protein
MGEVAGPVTFRSDLRDHIDLSADDMMTVAGSWCRSNAASSAAVLVALSGQRPTTCCRARADLRSACALCFGEMAGCAGVMRKDGGFGAECVDPLVPQQGVSRTAAAVACTEQVHGRLKNRLFLYGPAHRAQMLAETQGGRVFALGKVGTELYLAA